MTDDKAVQNVIACDLLDWPTPSYAYDENFPNTTAGSLWRDLLKYLLDGTLPPGTRVFCGVSVPDFPLDPPN